MDITSLLIQLVSGAVGGNIGGALLKNISLGPVGNSIAGIIGGPLGAAILGQLGMGGGGALASVGSGGGGGIILMLVVGFIKKAMAK
jgi:uncharacterized membrane protein YeaQ/YmgE (transglycosylase-associated protein family)